MTNKIYELQNSKVLIQEMNLKSKNKIFNYF